MKDEYRGEKLIYGDFLKLFDLKVNGNIGQVGFLSWLLSQLDRCLFFGFTSFILSRAGYYDVTMYDDSRYDWKTHSYEEQGVMTTDFDEEYWIDAIWQGLTGWTDELRMERDQYDCAILDDLKKFREWTHIYDNVESKKTLNVIYIPQLSFEYFLFRDKEDDSDYFNLALNPHFQNLVIIKPSEYATAKRTSLEQLQEFQDRLSKQEEDAALVSVDELAARFLPDPVKKQVIFENWITIRVKVLEKLQKEYPILVLALENKKLRQADDLLRRSRREFEDNKFDLAIRDAALACEDVLNIMYHKNCGKAPDRMNFEELLCSMKDMIETGLGPLVYSDLEFIRIWRNNVTHPQQEEIMLEKKTVLQVLARSEMFHELFLDMLSLQT